ncbi:Beta subunit of phenylphosphate carboxylase [uncultured Desulfobacterium sp.]|uniref:Beta subunit of phenylphosphate carboxylase n=1 Tax=uncultured Desulfobacterium sp. TaxID=201089 RepID=A0A445N117_9BACT|nr:Beta subunit of phenylphosphate carboxylase [uncultured Desulfobacterium sp.]
MAYNDMREWMATLEKEGMLSKVSCEVDWNREIGAVVRRVINQKGPALLFDNIKDHEKTFCRKLFTNSLGSRERVALAVGSAKDTPFSEITRTIKDRIARPSDVKVIDKGPVKENILKGEDIDLYQIPVPHWRPQDGGRYINTSCSVVTRNPDTGILNIGTYRGQIVDKDKIGVLLALTQHWGHHFTKYKEKGKEMPVAVVYGWDPTMLMMASAPLLHPGCSEYEYISSLRQEPCELVRCETNDLLVPASAEIVIEGLISPDPSTFITEGPFSEYTGYMGGMAAPRPNIKVTCITHRDDPIYRGTMEGATPHSWSESAWYTPPCFCAATWNLLETVGVPGVLDVWANNVTENTITMVRIKKHYRGHAKQVANAIWGSGIANYAGKIVIVVDDDIDIHDHEEVDWAISYRMNADMNKLLIFPGTFGSMLDPSVPLSQRNVVKYGQGKWSRVLVDATINWELEPEMQYGDERYPPLATTIEPEDENKVKLRWQEYGIKI